MYVDDEETGLYYLRSRYYSALSTRFLNADTRIGQGTGILSHNLYAYCCNAPICLTDPSGKWYRIALLCLGILTLSGCAQQNTPYGGQANCYAYALRLELDPRTGNMFRSKPQPGEFASPSMALTYSDLIKSAEEVKATIEDKVCADANTLGYTFTEVNSIDYELGEGEWMVALVWYYNPDTYLTDYHWYRRDEDGTWSHKPGSTPISTTDASGNIIYDPQSCDRGAYDTFLGYYVFGVAEQE